MDEGMSVLKDVLSLGVPGVMAVCLVVLWRWVNARLASWDERCSKCRDHYEGLIEEERKKRDDLVERLFSEAMKPN